MRNSVGIVELKGARERWIAPAALHTVPRASSESSWTITPETVIGLRLQGAAVEDHNRRVTRTSGPGRDFTLQPRGTPTRYLAYSSIKFGQVFLPDRLLDRASDAENLPALSGRLRDDLSFVPEKTLQTLTSDYLRRAFDPIIPATSLEMEGRALLLVDWLLRLHQSPRVGAASQTGGLSPRHLRRACDFMVEHLAEDICLDELAELTGLTGKHFARAFKQSTGLPPHQYLIMQRIEAAKRRLVDAQGRPRRHRARNAALPIRAILPRRSERSSASRPAPGAATTRRDGPLIEHAQLPRSAKTVSCGAPYPR